MLVRVFSSRYQDRMNLNRGNVLLNKKNVSNFIRKINSLKSLNETRTNLRFSIILLI